MDTDFLTDVRWRKRRDRGHAVGGRRPDSLRIHAEAETIGRYVKELRSCSKDKQEEITERNLELKEGCSRRRPIPQIVCSSSGEDGSAVHELCSAEKRS